MSMSVTIVDHHRVPDPAFVRNPKVKVVLGFDQDNYFENIKEYINRDFGYVFFDENPDAMIASVIYMLSREKHPNFTCFPREFVRKDLDKLIAAKKKNIIVFNNLKAYYSNFDEVDEIILINPYESGIENVSASQILYKTIDSPSPFMRDLASLSIVLDYTVDESFETIVEVVKEYPEVFSDAAQMIKDITLNKYSVQETRFHDFTSMLRAPSILYGIKGVDDLVKNLLTEPAFAIPDLMNGSTNKTIAYLKECSEEYKKILEEELALFEDEKQTHGVILSYTPKFLSENFVREFANWVKDHNKHSIIMVKTPTNKGLTKYSIRRGELNVDLGGVLSSMGVGGGNPFSAGCTVNNPDDFEREFAKNIELLNLT